MAQLIRKVEGEVFDNTIGSVSFLTPIIGQFQEEDYIQLNGLIAYLQNFSKTDYTSSLIKPTNFGLINQNNIPVVTLEINY